MGFSRRAILSTSSIISNGTKGLVSAYRRTIPSPIQVLIGLIKKATVSDDRSQRTWIRASWNADLGEGRSAARNLRFSTATPSSDGLKARVSSAADLAFASHSAFDSECFHRQPALPLR